MTNQEKFIQTFGIYTWQAMIEFAGFAEQFKEYWTSSYVENGKKISMRHESDDGKPEYIDRKHIEWYKCNLENCPICKQNDHDCSICDLARCYARQIRELPTVNLIINDKRENEKLRDIQIKNKRLKKIIKRAYEEEEFIDGKHLV